MKKSCGRDGRESLLAFWLQTTREATNRPRRVARRLMSSRRRRPSVIDNRQHIAGGTEGGVGGEARTAASAFSLAAFSSASRLSRSSLFLRRFSTEESAFFIISPTAVLEELLIALLTSLRASGEMSDIVGRRRLVSCKFVVEKLRQGSRQIATVLSRGEMIECLLIWPLK